MRIASDQRMSPTQDSVASRSIERCALRSGGGPLLESTGEGGAPVEPENANGAGGWAPAPFGATAI